MPLTLEQAKRLQYGDHVYDTLGNSVKINGKPQILKRNPNYVRVPIKYGFYGPYGYITNSNLNDFMTFEKGSQIRYKKYLRRLKPRGTKTKIRVGMKMFEV